MIQRIGVQALVDNILEPMVDTQETCGEAEENRLLILMASPLPISGRSMHQQVS
jgi:hypothetical protein